MEKMMALKFAGTCVCGQRVQVGVVVPFDFNKPAKERIQGCSKCRPFDVAPPPPPAANIALRVHAQRVKTVGKEGWMVASVTLDLESEQPANLPVYPNVPFDVSGTLGVVESGDLLEVVGTFENHAKWGTRFKASTAVPIVGGTLRSLAAFLTELPHIGPTTAKAIIQHFDQDRKAVLDAIENHPELLTGVRGVTPERAEAIQAAYRDGAPDLREVSIWLAGLELGEATTANALKTWKGDAKNVLAADPYRLMELRGLGFLKADELALSRFKIARDDPRRLTAAVLYLLTEEEGEGHTWTPLTDFIGHAPVAGF